MSINNDFNHVSFPWNIAESLRGTYKEAYRKVIIPMIAIRRRVVN